MKLVSFSPWQHATTSIPSFSSSSSNNNNNNNEDDIDIVQSIIMAPSGLSTTNNINNNSSNRASQHKKRKSTKHSSLSNTPDASNVQPIISITSSHQLCVLGHHHRNNYNHNQSINSKMKKDGNYDNNNNNITPKKILRQQNNNDETNLELKQVPQWIYNSRPDPTSSFFPHQATTTSTSSTTTTTTTTTNHRKIGAVVDPSSRHIFILQNNNQTLKVWSLDDDDVVGPDDDDNHHHHHDDDYSSFSYNGDNSNTKSNKIIKSIDFDSPVICMDMIPMKQRQNRRVKIKGTAGDGDDDENGSSSRRSSSSSDDIHGGVTGILSNGQMFILLICSSGTHNDNTCFVKMGLYGGITKNDIIGQYIHSVVGFTSSTTTTTTTTNTSVSSAFSNGTLSSSASSNQKKRKLSNGTHSTSVIANGSSSHHNNAAAGWGELSLTILSRRTKNQDSSSLSQKTDTTLTLTKHSVSISSLERYDSDMDIDTDDNLLSYTKIGGTHTQQEHLIQLPTKHQIVDDCANGKGSKHEGKFKDIFVTQLDTTHLGVVYYCTSDNLSYATIIDTKAGDCILTPFPLNRLKSTITSETATKMTKVTSIGGLSSSILAVLTSDSTLSLYDLRRAVKLHEVKLRGALLGTQQEENGVKYQYKIAANWFTGSICILSNASNGGENVSVSYARVGVYDAHSSDDVEETGRKKPFIKGSYNLARIIASSMATANNVISQCDQLDVHNISSDMSDWLPSINGKKKKKMKSNQHESHEAIVTNIISDLESYRPVDNVQENGKKLKNGTHTFLEAFEGMKQKLLQAQVQVQQQQLPSSSSKEMSSDKKIKSHKQTQQLASLSLRTIPQAIIDVSVSVAISIIFTNSKKNTLDKSNAMNVLLQCIKSGLVSGRNHFDQSVLHRNPSIRNGDTLRYLLLTLQACSKGNSIHNNNNNNNNTVETDTAASSSCYPLDLISNLLQHCKDGLTEQMLVSMVHFVLCHATEEQFAQHWKETQSLSSSVSKRWYFDSDIKVLEKRLHMALAQKQTENDKKNKEVSKTNNNNNDDNDDNDDNESSAVGNGEDVQNLVNNLQTRLAVSRQLHFIEKIVTHSKCNPALLRTALQSGLTQVEGGEIGVFIQALGKILRRQVGNTVSSSSSSSSSSSKKKTISSNCNTSHHFFGETIPNKSTCISQWLSALIDSNLTNLMQTTNNDKAMKQVQKEVSASIAQTKAILSLKELLCQMDRMIDGKKKKNSSSLNGGGGVGGGGSLSSSSNMEVVSSVPLYGIEQLIF